MQFSGLAKRALSEQGGCFSPYFYYKLTDLAVAIAFVGSLEGSGQDSVMSDAGRAFG
ncbi:hypothetical protein QWZ15_16060 [Cyclobacterium jeungdonense]|uniref:Uncharacterized protein n=1 Tax=Cyclobacterium jeungdonense TaxID=708087 RepID=A0ABT8C966_9BACT|nr:hypothetical protein [Cyclobacterium jeungdonense]MDN3689349.1 hypothetical protein [Cyclobacterium jeungdonense]